MTIFATAGSGSHGPQQLLADRVSASLTGAAVFVALALIVTLITHPRAGRILPARAEAEPRLVPAQHPGRPGTEALTETRAAA